MSVKWSNKVTKLKTVMFCVIFSIIDEPVDIFKSSSTSRCK